MKRDMKKFVEGIFSSPRRLAIPIMTSPGFELEHLRPSDVFRSGELEFRCIRRLAEETPADALVTFMDLSVEAEAFGSEIRWSEYENPTVSGSIASTLDEIEKLKIPEAGSGRTGEVLRCVELCAAGCDRPVLGGMIGPFSLAGRLADMAEIMILAAAEPETAELLLEKCTAFLTGYARAIRSAGADGLVIAEPAAGLLSPEMCGEFSVRYLREIIRAVQDDSFPVILHNCGNAAARQVPELLSSGARALHVGNAVDIREVLAQVPEDLPVMGNLDPVGVLRNGDPETVCAKGAALLEATSKWRNYVYSTGCDVPPGVPMENIRAFYRAVEEYNRTRS